ncbi:MAG: amino acid permease [Simkania negevensis]|nr:amino acid permease [Simkania negevensis]
MKAPVRNISVFVLAMINVAAILSIRNWPATADLGFSSLFYFLLASLIFFIPVSIVSAELATGWPQRGGIYVWVKEALGHRIGFLAAWLLWIENVVWYPTLLSFVGGTIAYILDPSLVHNKSFMFLVICIAFWAATLINLLGMKVSGWISTMGAIFGTLIPGALIIGLASYWMIKGNPIHISFSFDSLIPNLASPKQMAILTGILLGFAGMEMSAVHAKDVENPQKSYPRAILLSAFLIIILSILGTLSIALVIPQNEISLVSSSVAAISHFMAAYGFSWCMPIIALLIAFGALGQMSTWIVGPTKALLAAAQDGDLPPLLHKINKRYMPTAMLICQAAIVSILGVIFLYMPNVDTSFWILMVLASQLYLVMYILLFLAALILRYKRPNVIRAYRVPGGKFGLWAISLIGIFGAIFSIIIGFYPPPEINISHFWGYALFLGIGMVIFCSAPFLILFFKRPSWNK